MAANNNSNGARVLGGSYSASSVALKNQLISRQTSSPQPGDLRWTPRRDANKNIMQGKGHIGIVTTVSGSSMKYISGNSGGKSDRVNLSNFIPISSQGAVYVRPNYGNNSVNKVLDIALSQEGTQETGNNNTPYGKWFGMDGNAWCAMFVCWCFHQAYDSDADFEAVGAVEALGQWNGDEFEGPGEGRGVGIDGITFEGHVWGNSELATYYSRLLNGSYFSRTNRASHITVHNAYDNCSIEELAAKINESNKAYNYGIDSSGVIGLFVDEQMWTNSCDDWEADSYGINIVCAGTKKKGFGEATISALTDLLEDVYRRNFLYIVTFNNNVDDTLTLHRYYSKDSCPGDAAVEQLRKVATEVNKRLAANISTNFVQVGSRIANSRTNALRTQSLINVRQLRPYVVNIEYDVKPKDIDTTVMSAAGVVAAFIHCPEYSDKDKYQSALIYGLADRINTSAITLPFGYIINSVAETEEDIKKEAYWFYFIVVNRMPNLGVWLQPRFKCKNSEKEAFVQKWYEYFVDWGLKSKCGLYCTKKQANYIGWPLQCNYMPLWLAEEMTDSVCPDDELLTPTFFKLDDLSNYGISQTGMNAGDYNNMPGVDLGTGEETIVPEGTYTGELKVETSGGTTTITVPQVTDHPVAKKWESYTAITNQRTINYQITHSDKTITDELGFRKYDGRYLIAVGSGVCKQTGTYLDVKLADGKVIKCIMGDGKADAHTESMHIYTNVNNVWCCSEFIMDRKKKSWGGGDCSAVNGWSAPVVQFTVYNKRVVTTA